MSMSKVTIFGDRCKSCGLCVSVCPRQVLALGKNTLNAKGFHPAEVENPGHCTGCAMCFTMCPEIAIEVET